jgi:YebC/PmpR family DNA-binding regulatory protein
MSGHSKWSTIKRKKGVNDQKKAQVFTKHARLITMAVVEAGGIGDPEYNVKLRLAIERAKAENMPKDNIQRAIDRAKGPDANQLKEVVYEGFGPGGGSLVIVAATDNSNRTHTEVKNILEKRGGKMGVTGSVLYLFDKCGVVVFSKAKATEESVLEFGEKIGALDFEESEENYIIYIPFEKIGQIKETTDIFYRPKTSVTVSAEGREEINQLLEAFEDQDDVSEVYSNYE